MPALYACVAPSHGTGVGRCAAMLDSLAAFVPLAALLALSPGPATAMVVHSAARGGRSRALAATSGNALGLALWAVASMLGVSALVVASETAYGVLKVCGAIVLIAFGLRALAAARGRRVAEDDPRASAPRPAFRAGLVTALANPKVALFYVALLPQFVPPGAAVLPMTLLLAGVQIGLSCAWYAVLAAVVARARRAVARRRDWIEALSGTAMIAFGAKLLGSAR